jgi:adenylate kinase family enzyme
MRRVVVVGTSGSGKSTLARQIASLLDAAHIELDALHWEANWTPTPIERFRVKVRDAVAAAGKRWVICGHYRNVAAEFWPHADTIVWLDYPMSLVARRVLLRTIRRCWTHQELCNGNRERLWVQLFSRDSLFLWVINTWRIRRRDYPKHFRSEMCRHLQVVRLRSPEETEEWLRELSAEPSVTNQSH